MNEEYLKKSRYKLTETECSYCKNTFTIAAHRLNKGINVCCSILCANRLKACVRPIYNKTPRDIIEKVKKIYSDTLISIEDIVKSHNVSRTVVFKYARNEHWTRPPALPLAVRRTYRKAAEKYLGRKLKKGEHVHHIDGDKRNNNDDNLEVFPSHKEHALCHGNLEKIAYSLIRQKKILFNRETKTYYLSEEIKDNDNNT
jgi:hypothetical protein